MRSRLKNLRVPAACLSAGSSAAEARATERCEILIDGERIVAVERASKASPASPDEDVVDLRDALVLPGVIDGHVHFDEPGFTHREDFETGTRAAAAGGVSCVVDMPCTSLPPVTCGDNLHNKLSFITPKAHVDFMLWGGACDNSMAESNWREHLRELAEEGVGSVKVYMLSGMETFRDLSRDQIREVLQVTERLGVPVGVHAEDRDLVHELTRWLQDNDQNDLLDYAASRPAEAEHKAVATMRDLCRETGAQVHIVHVGTGSAVDLIAEARADGLPMSGETCPHFLEFTSEDLNDKGSILKTAPVVKSAADRERIWQGVISGELSYVATDHAAGQWPDEKNTGNAWSDYGGVPGVELLLPYLYSEGVVEGRLSLGRLVEITASEPARFFGIDARKGHLAPGYDADLVVFDDRESWTVSAEDLHSKNRYTPHEGQQLTGRVRSLYVRGARVFHRDRGRETFAAPGTGQWVRRGSRGA